LQRKRSEKKWKKINAIDKKSEKLSCTLAAQLITSNITLFELTLLQDNAIKQ